MKKKTKRILLGSIAILLLGIVLYPSFKGDKQDDASQRAAGNGDGKSRSGGGKSDKDKAGKGDRSLHVNAQVLTYGTLTDEFRTKGLLLPDEEVDLSFETAGKITTLSFQEGASVKKGQLLAKVNDAPLQAELKKLQAQLPLAKDRVYRQQTLLKEDAVSQEAYQSASTEYEKLLADIALVRTKLAQTELRAPFDGKTGLRKVSEGAYASVSTVITRLTKTTPLKIEFSVNEAYVEKIQAGTPINFSVAGDGNTYTATVYAIESNLDRQTLTLKARARYANPGAHLKSGLSCDVTVRLNEITNTLVVPSLAVVAEMGRDVAYIYKEGKAVAVTLQKGQRTSSSIQVLAGLSVGDTLLTTGVMQLRDGSPVVIDRLK